MHWIKLHTALTLFFLVCAVGFILSPSIGPAWDEPDNMYSAGVYLNFFTHGFDPSYFTPQKKNASAFGDRIFPNDNNLAHLPPVHNYVGLLFILGARILNIPVTSQVIIIAWHLATVVFFAVLVSMTYQFGLLLGLSAGSSLFAALAVFMYPQLFGHGLSNSKDTAQAAMVVTSLYFLVKNNLILGAILWGLGMATKFNAVYVPIIWGLWALVQGKLRISRFIFQSLLILVIGLTTMVVVWPYLWFDTIQHVTEVVKYFTTVGQGYRVIWDGTWYFVGTGKTLWWYPLTSFLYTSPIPLLVLIFFGGLLLFLKLRQKPAWVILPMWIVIPLIRTLSPWAAFYDLLRHFLEIIPAIILVAAIGLEWFFQKKQHLVTTGIMLTAIILLGYMLSINISLFPYSTGYYNILARDPNINFDRDIEALSVKEAVVYLHRVYGNVRVYFGIGGHQSWYYLTPGDQYVYTPKDADVIVLVNKASHFRISELVAQALSGYTMVHDIRRGNAIFAWIYKKD
jgi:hypothetical protein